MADTGGNVAFLGIVLRMARGAVRAGCFHHKWKKLSFMVVFWLCVILNVTAVLCILFPDEAKSLVEAGIACLK